MGYWTGRFGPLSSGAQTLNTGLTGTPIGCRITVGGKSSDSVNHGSVGTYDGTRQNVQYWSPTSSGTTNSDVIWIKDGSGTTQLKASATSLSSSGGNGTVGLNVSTLDTGFQPTVEVWN